MLDSLQVLNPATEDVVATVPAATVQDVDAAVAARYRAGELTLMGAVQAGLFRPLGRGDAGIAEVLPGAPNDAIQGWTQRYAECTQRGFGRAHQELISSLQERAERLENDQRLRVEHEIFLFDPERIHGEHNG